MDSPERTRKLYGLLKIRTNIGAPGIVGPLRVTKKARAELEVSDRYMRQRPKGFGGEGGVLFRACVLCSLCCLAVVGAAKRSAS